MAVEKINVLYGAVVTVLAAIFGKYWMLFAGFLLLNAVDYLTGVAKAKWSKTESSAVGAKGIEKKVYYWVVIGVAFFIAKVFIQIGEVINIDLGFTMAFGWLTLATYLVNEARSILENLVEMDIKVPQFLIRGLEITAKMLKEKETEDGIQTED